MKPQAHPAQQGMRITGATNVVLCLVLVALGGINVWTYRQLEVTRADLRTSMQTQEDVESNALTELGDVLNEKLDAVYAKQAKSDTDAADILQRLQRVEAQVAAHAKDVEDVQNDIATDQGNDKKLNTQLQTIIEAVSKLQQGQQQLAGAVSTLRDAASQADATVKQLMARVAQINTELAQAGKELAATVSGARSGKATTQEGIITSQAAAATQTDAAVTVQEDVKKAGDADGAVATGTTKPEPAPGSGVTQAPEHAADAAAGTADTQPHTNHMALHQVEQLLNQHQDQHHAADANTEQVAGAADAANVRAANQADDHVLRRDEIQAAAGHPTAQQTGADTVDTQPQPQQDDRTRAAYARWRIAARHGDDIGAMNLEQQAAGTHDDQQRARASQAALMLGRRAGAGGGNDA